MPSSPPLHRTASIGVEETPDGYWRGEVVVHIPDLVDYTDRHGGFHTAGEALEWARTTIETVGC